MNINVTTKNYKVQTFEGKDFAKVKVFDDERFVIYEPWISPAVAEDIKAYDGAPLTFIGYTNKEFFTTPKSYLSKVKDTEGDLVYEYKKC